MSTPYLGSVLRKQDTGVFIAISHQFYATLEECENAASLFFAALDKDYSDWSDLIFRSMPVATTFELPEIQ